MSLALNESSVVRHFKHGNAIEILDRIIFDFYTGLPHVVLGVFALIYMLHKHLKFEAYEKF